MKKIQLSFDSIMDSPGSDKKYHTNVDSTPARFVAEELLYLDIDQLRPGSHQPRAQFNNKSLSELSTSIKEKGLLQPIIVRRNSREEGLFEIVAGERRWKAAILANVRQIPCLICHMSDKDSSAYALLENIQREDLNPLEEAAGYNRLINEFEMTHSEISRVIGKSRSVITNALRLLSLQDEIKQHIITGGVQVGHAKVLLSVHDEKSRIAFCKKIIKNRLSVRELENIIKRESCKIKLDNKTINSIKQSQLSAIERKFSLILGLETLIKFNEKQNSGKIEIKVNSFEALLDLSKRLQAIK